MTSLRLLNLQKTSELEKQLLHSTQIVNLAIYTLPYKIIASGWKQLLKEWSNSYPY